MIDYDEDPWAKSFVNGRKVEFFWSKRRFLFATLRNIVAVEDRNYKSFGLHLKYYPQHAN